MKEKLPKIGEEITSRKYTPMLDIVFEQNRCGQERWTPQAINVIIEELREAGFGTKFIETLTKKFFERVE